MLVEDVQRHRRRERIAERVLLVQEGGIGAGLALMPRAPLADDQPHPLGWIVSVHDRRMARDDRVVLSRLLHQFRPLGFREHCRLTLPVPATGQDVAVQVEAVDHSSRLTHHHFRPSVRFVIRARRDAKGAYRPVAGQKAGEAFVDVGVVLRPHVAATSPALVADPPEADVPRLRSAIATSLLGHRAGARMVHVLPPFGHFLDAAAADIADDEWLGAELLREFQEFVCADAVVLGDAAPVVVHHAGTPFTRPDAILPVVVVRETAARPTQVGDLDGAQRLHDVIADAPATGVPAHPDPVVDAPAEMLRKVPVDVPADRIASLIGVDDQRLGDLRRRAGPS